MSPVGLVLKNSGDIRMIHNLSYPLHQFLNDFINPALYSVRYVSINDVVKMMKPIGKRGKLSKAAVKVHLDML